MVVETTDGVDIGLVSGARAGGKKGDRFRAKYIATDPEVQAWKGLLAEESLALEYMKERVQLHCLPIELHRAEFQIDRKKLTLHYSTNSQHPDFSGLLHDGYQKFGCRIWLNNCQPGVGNRGEPLDLSAPPIPTLG